MTLLNIDTAEFKGLFEGFLDQELRIVTQSEGLAFYRPIVDVDIKPGEVFDGGKTRHFFYSGTAKIILELGDHTKPASHRIYAISGIAEASLVGASYVPIKLISKIKLTESPTQ